MRALVFLGLTACSSILGIGDLPAPAADGSIDSGVDAALCSGTTQRCGNACIDITSSLDHCGGCDMACPMLTGAARACTASLCTLDVDESMHRAWSLAAPGPYLAFWKDGTLLASNGSTSSKLIPTTGTPTAQNFTALAGRHTIVIPSVTSKPEVAISHYAFYEGRTQADVQEWMNDVNGCCGSGPDGFAVDPILDRLFTGHGVTELNTETGATAKATSTHIQHGTSFYVTATALYLPRINTAMVTKYDRAHAEQWTTAISTVSGVTNGAAAIAPDGGILVASATGDKLSRLLPTGAKHWEIDVTGPKTPITTSTGLVILGATKNAMPSLCAFKIADGAEAWCTPLSGAVIDALAGNDGVIYTAVTGATTIYGLDRATGAVRYTFRNTNVVEEMLLRGSRLYFFGAGTVSAIDVPATGYDASSWPVRFHDNQRTRGTQATLDY